STTSTGSSSSCGNSWQNSQASGFTLTASSVRSAPPENGDDRVGRRVVQDGEIGLSHPPHFVGAHVVPSSSANSSAVTYRTSRAVASCLANSSGSRSTPFTAKYRTVPGPFRSGGAAPTLSGTPDAWKNHPTNSSDRYAASV